MCTYKCRILKYPDTCMFESSSVCAHTHTYMYTRVFLQNNQYKDNQDQHKSHSCARRSVKVYVEIMIWLPCFASPTTPRSTILSNCWWYFLISLFCWFGWRHFSDNKRKPDFTEDFYLFQEVPHLSSSKRCNVPYQDTESPIMQCVHKQGKWDKAESASQTHFSSSFFFAFPFPSLCFRLHTRTRHNRTDDIATGLSLIILYCCRHDYAAPKAFGKRMQSVHV